VRRALSLVLFCAVLGPGCGDAEASSTVDVTVELDGPSRRISPYVYGMNWSEQAREGEAFTLVRWGGTRVITYNWENNASNAGHDPPANQNDGHLCPSTEPGAAVLQVLDTAQRMRAAAVITVPMIGYVAADRNADGDVGRTPDYIVNRFAKSLARGGRLDPDDRVVHQDAFVRFVRREAEARGVRVLFALDNEPASWPVTQPRLREGRPVRYAELVGTSAEYASMIRREAPRAPVLGPVTFGWPDMNDLAGAPDAGGRHFLSYYLDELRRRGRGQRLLDVLDVHWYPDVRVGGEAVSSGSGREDVARARMQLPRSLYDAEYEEPSWIAEQAGPIELIPRLRRMIGRHYPGTKLAITEWSYGGGDDPSGAVATADALGAFGAHGVYAAAYWPLFGQEHRYALAAFRMFRQIDGELSFGDRSIPAESGDPERLGAWASRDAQGRLFVVLTGRSDRALDARLSLGMSSTARRFVLDRQGPMPRELEPIAPRDGTYVVPIPARSVTTLIVDCATGSRSTCGSGG
jgi:mannan endo-1,4-beta-mannosidase